MPPLPAVPPAEALSDTLPCLATNLVLVVDDNAATAALVARQLGHHGFDTCCAGDGAGAIALARARHPDLVLLDANLPDIDGTEVCRTIKSDPQLAGTLVAFLSAERTDVRHRIAGLETGADAYLTHPVDEAELAASVRSLLRLRRAELAARDSSELYRNLLDAAPIGIAHVALDGIVVAANRALATLLAAEPGDLAGRLFDVFLHPDERATMRAVFAEVIAGIREPGTRELRLLTAAGTTAWAGLAGRLHRRPDGSVSHVIVALEDITARKTAETALRQRDHLLHELYEASHDLIATVSAEGRILQANSALHRAVGVETGSLRDAPLEAFLAPAFRAAWHAALDRVAGGAGDELFRGTLLGASQATIHIEGFLGRRDTPAGPAVRVILHDVTEHRRLEEQLLRNQRLDSIGTLAGGIAHDLNNVLSPIFLSLGLIRSAESAEERQDYLDGIERSARRASDLVRQMLLFARGAGVEKTTVDPAATLRELEQMLRETFPRNIEITCAVDGSGTADLGLVHANPTQLNQVLLNLCLNARDAMHDGGRLTVDVRAGRISDAEAASHPGAVAGPAVIFTVNDTGQGIPAEVHDRIFDPFFTTKGIGQGTGLGLPTALGIARSHGGFITFQSAPGQGSTFQVHLPLAPDGHRRTPVPPQVVPQRRQGELVLLVDDEVLLRQAAERLLRAHGYRVITAADGVEAIARVSTVGTELHAVVTDIMMPRLDGYAAAAAIRRIVPGLPVIGMTGYAGPDLAARAQAAGLARVVAKPFEPEELLRALEAALQHRPVVARPATDAAFIRA